MVKKIRLKLSNAYLLHEDAPILVDTGAPGEGGRIIAALKRFGVEPADLSLILHTHVHSDHVGGTPELRSYTDAPTAIHRGDQGLMDRGHNGELIGIGLRGRIMASFFRGASFAPFVPDLYLEDGMSLYNYGIAGHIVHTPGHTPGSVSVLLASGEAIIGDLLMGGYLGGNLFPSRPNYHYFAEDLELVRRSIGVVMAGSPKELYPGHGGPLAPASIKRIKEVKYEDLEILG